MTEKPDELPRQAYELALAYEQTREHCAQCTLAGIMESLGEVDETLFRAADGLTGGTALSTEGTCGALVGGILAVSRYAGRSYKAFRSGQADHSWEPICALYDRFVTEYGGPLGKQVQQTVFGTRYRLRDAIERRMFEQAGAHTDKCPAVCGNAAKWSVEIILQLRDIHSGW